MKKGVSKSNILAILLAILFCAISFIGGYYLGVRDNSPVIFTAAHSEGHTAGYENGYNTGYDAGYDDGYEKGEVEAKANVSTTYGYRTGYSEGYKAGAKISFFRADYTDE